MLRGKKILLRYPELSDADILYEWENDKSHWKISGTQKPFTKKEIKDFILNRKDIYLDKQLRWMIAFNEKLVGCIDLFDFNQQRGTAGIGILIDKNCRRKGCGSEALSLVINYSFEILNLKQLYSKVSSDNTASMKLFMKHKFKTAEKKKHIHLFRLINKRLVIAY